MNTAQASDDLPRNQACVRAPRTIFALKPQPPLLQPVVAWLLGVFVAILLTAVVGSSMSSRFPFGVALASGAVIGCPIGLLVLYIVGRRISPPPIEISAVGVSLPRSVRSSSTVQLAFNEIISVEADDGAEPSLLVIGSRRGDFVFSGPVFLDGISPCQVRVGIHSAIEAGPDGARRIGELFRQERGSVAFHRRLAFASPMIGAVFALLWSMSILVGIPGLPSTSVTLGANAPALVLEGQWWRLFSTTFVPTSGGVLALGAISMVGGRLERLLGSARFLVVTFGACVAANLTTLATQWHPYSAGASSIPAGLLGAVLTMELRHGGALPAGFRLRGFQSMYLAGVVVLCFLIPGLDGLEHFASLVVGAALTLILVPVLEVDSRERRMVIRCLAIALVSGYSVAIGFAIFHALRLDRQEAEAEWIRATQFTRRMPAYHLPEGHR